MKMMLTSSLPWILKLLNIVVSLCAQSMQAHSCNVRDRLLLVYALACMASFELLLPSIIFYVPERRETTIFCTRLIVRPWAEWDWSCVSCGMTLAHGHTLSLPYKCCSVTLSSCSTSRYKKLQRRCYTKRPLNAIPKAVLHHSQIALASSCPRLALGKVYIYYSWKRWSSEG